MARDRETTLAAVATCLGQLVAGGPADAGVMLFARNRIADISDRPSLVMMDGDDGTQAQAVVLRERLGFAGGSALDQVEIEIWGEVEDDEAAIGARLNALEDAVIKILATDAALGAALSDHSTIVKNGTVKTFTATEQVLGRFGLTITVGYILKPTDPATA